MRPIVLLAATSILGVAAGSRAGDAWLIPADKIYTAPDVAPIQGGATSIILTTEEGGRYYAVSEGGGKFFVAANVQTRKAVFSAAALGGSGQVFYAASGHLNRSLLLGIPSGERAWRVA